MRDIEAKLKEKNMSIEAMKQALEALERSVTTCFDQYAHQQAMSQPDHFINQTITSLRQAIAEAEKQKPVAVGDEWKPCVKLPIVVHVREQRKGETHVSTREGITPVKDDDLIMRGVAGEEYPIGRELFNQTYTFDTAPPKREWVGLTDEEIDGWNIVGHESLREFVRAIEAKLKEKNGG